MPRRTSLILLLTALMMLCRSLAAADSWDICLPESLAEIGESAFEGNTSLNRVYVSDQAQTIGALAFANSSLRDIRLPESITAIASDAFLNVPHVEVYGSWDDDFFTCMDNVSMSGAELPINQDSTVPVASGQEVLRSIPPHHDREMVLSG